VVVDKGLQPGLYFIDDFLFPVVLLYHYVEGFDEIVDPFFV
jgi:hypothetical protein